MEANVVVPLYKTPVFSESNQVVSMYDELRAFFTRRHLPTAEHSLRVRVWAASLGSSLGLTDDELSTLTLAAEIHDIGKLHVPVSILNKPCALSDDEWLIVKQHPVWGAYVASVAFPDQPEVAQCVLCHHERLDGSGYPNNLKGDEIPFLARIVSVTDAFIALTEDRPYRRGYTEEEALNVLAYEDKGKYDIDVIQALSRLIRNRAAA